MDMPGRSYTAEAYRYGYQGSERDRNMQGGTGYTTFFRSLDPRLGRWLNPDPKKFPWQSPYCSMDCNPVALTDVMGAETEKVANGGELPGVSVNGVDGSPHPKAKGFEPSTVDSKTLATSSNPSIAGQSEKSWFQSFFRFDIKEIEFKDGYYQTGDEEPGLSGDMFKSPSSAVSGIIEKPSLNGSGEAGILEELVMSFTSEVLVENNIRLTILTVVLDLVLDNGSTKSSESREQERIIHEEITKKFSPYTINNKTPDGRAVTVVVQPGSSGNANSKTGYCTDSTVIITKQGVNTDTVEYKYTLINKSVIIVFPKDSTGKRQNGSRIE